jgi:sec-independent protein translocase protein TatB
VFESWEKLLLLAMLGLFIFGPERLPEVVRDAARMIRTLRSMARNATSELSTELGTQIELEDLHPKRFIRKHLLSEEEERELRRPFTEAFDDVREATSLRELASERPSPSGLEGSSAASALRFDPDTT